jgi:hypothetical protein
VDGRGSAGVWCGRDGVLWGRRGLEVCHEEFVLLIEHVDEALLFLLLLGALECVSEGVASVALLLVVVGVVAVGFLGGFLEVVGFADDFEWLGGEFFVIEFEADAE